MKELIFMVIIILFMVITNPRKEMKVCLVKMDT